VSQRQRRSGGVIAGIALIVMVMASGVGARSGAAAAAAQSGGDAFSSAAKYFGTWSGTWDGAGSGGFELTLEKKTDGVAGGKVSVTGEPTYKATLKTLKFDGQKMSALYDFPPDDRLEIALSATFDGDSAKGTWTARGKDGGAEMMSGGWTVKKKP
jgi:hypothetical protein